MSEENNERIASLEAGYKNLHRDVQNLAEAVGSLGRDFRSTMDSIQNQFFEHQKTPWSVLAAWAAVIISTIGIVGSFYIRDLEDVKRQLEGQGIAILTGEQKDHERHIAVIKELHRIEIQQIREDLKE